MNDHTFTLTLNAPPQTVYPELATPAGIRRWWSAGAEGAEEIGGIIRITFREQHWTEMRITTLLPGREVGWDCVAQHEPGLARPDEWVGTSVQFLLEPAPGGATTLRFAHRGLAGLECFEQCRRGWSFYVGESLRALVETGVGRPDTPATARVPA